MRLKAWIGVIITVGTVYFLSSVPSLQVLPVLRSVHSFFMNIDQAFINSAHWLAAQIPLETGGLYYIDTATRDFLIYASNNPIVFEFILRKLAHVFVFFVITIAVFFLLHQYIKRSRYAVLLAFILTSIFAFVDEYRQTMIPGRVGSLVDVGIDMVGITLATLLIIFSLFLTKTGRERFYIAEAQQLQTQQQSQLAPEQAEHAFIPSGNGAAKTAETMSTTNNKLETISQTTADNEKTEKQLPKS